MKKLNLLIPLLLLCGCLMAQEKNIDNLLVQLINHKAKELFYTSPQTLFENWEEYKLIGFKLNPDYEELHQGAIIIFHPVVLDAKGKVILKGESFKGELSVKEVFFPGNILFPGTILSEKEDAKKLEPGKYALAFEIEIPDQPSAFLLRKLPGRLPKIDFIVE